MQTYQTLAVTRVLIAMPAASGSDDGAQIEGEFHFPGGQDGQLKGGKVLALELADGTLLTLVH